MAERAIERVIDAHQHFWTGAMPWMEGAYAALARPFGADDVRPLLAGAGVEATVLVQVQASLTETQDFLALAEATDFIAGVVGWVPLDDTTAGALRTLRDGPHGRWLVGVRHLVQDEPDPAWLLRPEVRRGLSAVADAGLVYDLLVRPPQLAAAVATARAFPDLRLVLDHIAKPPIAHGWDARWADAVAALAEHAQVRCKLSGLVTEADHATWSPADLTPAIAHALHLFGPERCMFGSDWPVCTVAATYGAVKAALEGTFDALGLTPAHRAAVMGGTAARTYDL